MPAVRLVTRTEQEEVELHRLKEALRLGFKFSEAAMFATSQADTGELRRLISAGCPPETAARILI